MEVARSLLRRAAWAAVALLIALGGAGVVTAMNAAAGGARPERTWTEDVRASAALDRAAAALEALTGEVDALGTQARLALAAVVAGDVAVLGASIEEGSRRLDAAGVRSEELRAALASVPGMDAPDAALRYSEAVRARHARLSAAAGVTASLARDWTDVAGRALDAARLADLLERHDEQTAGAAREGTAERYAQALERLDTSDAILRQAGELRDALARTADMSTLTAWLDRNAAYDQALRRLYAALLASDGRVTDAVRRAFAAERAARDRLPADTRALTVIMAEVSRAGLNQAVISIEEARGRLGEALEG